MNSDFKDLLQCLSEASAEYLVIGGYAVIEYTEPRYTKDLDILIGTSAENAERVYSALARFGAPLADIKPRDIAEPDVFLQIGVAPVRVDVITTIPGVEFADAYSRRVVREVDGVTISIMSLSDLMQAKEASGRRQDKADAKALRRAAEMSVNQAADESMIRETE